MMTMSTTALASGADDWQNDLTLAESSRYMLDNQIDCDVWFTLLPSAASGEELPVTVGSHHFVLVSRSPVFYAMLSGPLSVSTAQSSPSPSPPAPHRRRHQQQQQQPAPSNEMSSARRDIRISDIAPSIFWQLLRYLYSEELDLTEDNVFAILYAAKKYLVTSLSRRCVKYLESVLAPDNVCVFLENVFLFEDEYPGLRQRCFQVVERQSKTVFHSDAFFEISKDTLGRVLRMERLSVHEIDVFRACLHWAERRASLLNLALTPANKRQVLGDTLRLIHFPAMSIDEFTKIVVPAGLLEVDEENTIFRVLLGAAADPVHSASAAAAAEATATKTSPPAFPRNSRNFVTTRCDINYDGYVRHGASASSLFRGSTMPQRSGWSLTMYCDHSIKIQEIGLFGQMKGNVYVMQNGYRKMDVTSSSPTRVFRFGDELQLDAGHFTVGADAPFTYSGDCFTRSVHSTGSSSGGAGGVLPSVTADQDRVNLVVREAGPLGVLSYVVFVPTDEIYFIENYYSDDSLELCARLSLSSA